jgi:hypothetical protein
MKNPEGAATADAENGGLSARSRALVGLRVGAQRNDVFVWRHYVRVALRLGLTPNQVIRVAVGPTVFDGEDSAVLWAVDHTLARRSVDAVTLGTLGQARASLVETTVWFDVAIAVLIEAAEPEVSDVAATIRTPAAARGAYADQTG